MGKITAQIVFVQPTCANSTKVGITSAVVGTMTAPSRIANEKRFPAKLYFASP